MFSCPLSSTFCKLLFTHLRRIFTCGPFNVAMILVHEHLPSYYLYFNTMTPTLYMLYTIISYNASWHLLLVILRIFRYLFYTIEAWYLLYWTGEFAMNQWLFSDTDIFFISFHLLLSAYLFALFYFLSCSSYFLHTSTANIL